MLPTTLKLPPALKKRIAPLARKSGKTPHAWMVEALSLETDRSERWERFVDEAEEAASEIDAGEAVFEMADVHSYLRARASGERTNRPKAVRSKRRR